MIANGNLARIELVCRVSTGALPYSLDRLIELHNECTIGKLASLTIPIARSHEFINSLRMKANLTRHRFVESDVP